MYYALDLPDQFHFILSTALLVLFDNLLPLWLLISLFSFSFSSWIGPIEDDLLINCYFDYIESYFRWSISAMFEGAFTSMFSMFIGAYWLLSFIMNKGIGYIFLS